MAQQIKKKFIGDKQVDGSKILLEDVKSVKVKDSTSTEIDLIKLNVADQVVIPNDVILEGDLTVQGAITSIESATLQVTDANVVVNKDGNLASADSAGAGITVEMSDATDAAVSFDSSLASKFKIGEVGAQHQIVSTAHAQALTNKTIDADSNTISNLEVDNLKAGVLDTDLSSVSISDDTIPSAKAVKSYVDSEVSAAQGAVDAVEDDVSHLVTLSGVAVDSDDLGTFTGVSPVISANSTIKEALQDLSSAVEAISGGGSGSLSGLQSELDATQLGAGLEVDGSYVAPVGSNYLGSATSLKDADSDLDAQLKIVADDLAQEITDRSNADSAIQSELDTTQSGAGLGIDGSYSAPVGSNYLGSAVSLKDADSKLDSQIKTVADGLAQEITDRTNADSALQGEIDALELLQDDYVALDGSRPMTGNLNMSPSVGVHNKVVGLADPQDPRDAANKQYVDAIAEGLHVHAPARLLADFDLDGVYDNGVDGVGAFLNTSASPIAGIDGVSSFSVGDRIIVAFQNGSNLDPENGIYFIAEASDINGNGDIIKLTRAVDFNTPSEMAGGDFIFVQSGSQYANTGWVMSETVTTVGTTPVKFVQFSGAGTYSAGDALDLTGTEFSVRVDNSTIVVNASNDLEIAPAVMTDLAGKVNKAGDTMEGDLVMDFGNPGISTTISDGTITVVNTDDQTSIAADDVSVSSAAGPLTITGNLYSGNLELTASDSVTGDSASALISVGSANSTFSQAANDSLNQFNGQSDLSVSSLDFSFLDQATGMSSTTSYQHNSISIQQNDGTNSSSFTVTPGVSVDFLSNGAFVTPTADSHLAPKKYVDDQVASASSSVTTHLNDTEDAHDASAISFNPSYVDSNIVATEVQAAIQELDAGKVAKAGDVMTGQLTMQNADIIVDYSTVGVNILSTSIWDGEILLENQDLVNSSGSTGSLSSSTLLLAQNDNATSSNTSLQISANPQILSASITDGVNGTSGTVDIGLGSISLGMIEPDSSIYTADYATSSFAVSKTDGTTGEITNIIADIGDGAISVYSDTGSGAQAIAPTQEYHLTPKKYVDDSIAAHVDLATDAHDASAISVSPAINGQSDVQSALADHESRIDSLEGALDPTWGRIKFDLEATDISNGYVDLPHEAIANSIHAFVDRLAIHQDEDFLVSVVSGVTRITFAGDLVAPSESQLEDTDNIYVRYQYLA